MINTASGMNQLQAQYSWYKTIENRVQPNSIHLVGIYISILYSHDFSFGRNEWEEYFFLAAKKQAPCHTDLESDSASGFSL